MNRNVESHFSSVPQIKHPRSTFDRSFSHSTTFNVGEVVPVLAEEILPGDTVSIQTSKICRLQTMLSPIYGNMYLDTYFFFVPNRILWKHWKEFMGENTTSSWIPSVNYTVPKIQPPPSRSSSDHGWNVGTIADHLGYPVGVTWSHNDRHCPSALPFRAVAMICNDFFRDQNLTDPLVIDTGDSNVTGSNDAGLDAVQLGGKPFIASKFHDYFTSCLPAPQKGPSVTIGGEVRGKMPVIAGEHVPFTPQVPVGSNTAYIAPTLDVIFNPASQDHQTVGIGYIPENVKGGTLSYSPAGDPYISDNSSHHSATFSNLWAVSEGGSLSGVEFDINTLRLAIATQMYYEALARGGSRYEEQIAQFFGVTNPDARVQHPEYLGGNRVALNVHEITNTSQSEQDFLGDLGAKSVTLDTHADFVKSFTEHGWLIGVCVARYDHTYSDGLPAKFCRTDKFSFYNPLFSNIGEQPVYSFELLANSSTLGDDTIFGYQEAWSSYRTSQNMVTGSMRPGHGSASFSHWTLADNYVTPPVLSDGWIREDKTNVDRVLAVTSSLSDQVFADFYFKAKFTRTMPMFSVPGTLGSF